MVTGEKSSRHRIFGGRWGCRLAETIVGPRATMVFFRFLDSIGCRSRVFFSSLRYPTICPIIYRYIYTYIICIIYIYYVEWEGVLHLHINIYIYSIYSITYYICNHMHPFSVSYLYFSIFGRVVSSTDLAGEPRSEWLSSPESQGIYLSQWVAEPVHKQTQRPPKNVVRLQQNNRNNNICNICNHLSIYHLSI